jgi:hypothetical protein
MKIENVPFALTTWDEIMPTEHKGETGTSYWRTFETGNIRVRMVDYSAGFRSDHYCPRGHVLLVLKGEFFILLKNGISHVLTAGMSFQTADDEANPHLAYSDMGATVFIVD